MDLQRNASVHRKQLRGEPPQVGDEVTAFRSLVGAKQKGLVPPQQGLCRTPASAKQTSG